MFTFELHLIICVSLLIQRKMYKEAIKRFLSNAKQTAFISDFFVFILDIFSLDKYALSQVEYFVH